MPKVVVEIVSPAPALVGAWEDLIRRAGVNVFMNPAALNAAHATNFAKVHVLLAWDRSVAPARLVGLWGLEERRVAPFCPRFLAAPPFDYSFMSSPVVDPAFMDDAIPAFLDAIEQDPRLPNAVRLKNLDGDAATYAALRAALAARGSHMLLLAQTTRPFVSGESDLKRSGSTRKKLRQDWNRLATLGAADVVNEREPERVRAAFEVFLAMEGESWKGDRGTALMSNTRSAAFTRRLICDLAAQKDASVALLRVGGKAVAAQVLLYCGRTAYTWKTAFDADYAKYSPGMLLIDKVTDELFAAGIEAIDSCAVEGSFMGHLWTGRRGMTDLLANVGHGQSLGFAASALAELGRAQLRALRDRLRAARRPLQPQQRALPASR